MAAPVSKPPLGSALKAAPTSSTHSHSVAFTTGKPAPACPTSPVLAHRRSVRPTPADFLSDKATIALIRRTLCAQQVADRGRSTPAPIEELLPPLTSRNDVDLQLYALISIVIREYVQKWYERITPDETFVAEVVQIIAHCTRALEQRLRKVYLESLLLDELPELLDAHVRAYRIAQNSSARLPIESSHREIYHSLCPLPALSPVPKPEDPKSVQVQVDNETAYRQLLVQGVLAVLLPTEDLENDCLTSLVGQIFSELIIGNLIANKVSQPWLLWELIIVMTRLVDKKRTREASGASESETTTEPSSRDSLHSPEPTTGYPTRSREIWSIHQIFWFVLQWVFFAVNSVRLIISTIVLSRTLPARPASAFVPRSDATGQHQSEKSFVPSVHSERQSPTVKVPIIDFNIWPAIVNLLEMNVRMPWLSGAFSILQWGAMKGPGRLAAYDGLIDRLLSYHIHARLLDPAILPPLLRSIRGVLFPNNAPGAPGLVPPSSDEELAALRRKCASAIWALVPKGVGRLYFGSVSFWPSSTSKSSSVNTTTKNAPRSSEGPTSSFSNSEAAASSTTATGRAEQKVVGEGKPERGSSNATSTSSSSNSRSSKIGKQGRLGQIDDPGDTGEQQQQVEYGAGDQAVIADGKATEDRGSQEGEVSPFLCNHDEDKDEENRILSEIETGVLDVFSDAYCNKHLMYGALELILVRLMPELADKGIIELWEEKLS